MVMAELDDFLFRFQRSILDNHNEEEERAIKEIRFSVKAINHSIEPFELSEPEISVAFGKLIVMELWNVRQFLNILRLDTIIFDQHFPHIKEFRDSYAHIDERVKGTYKSNGEKKKLEFEKSRAAAGMITSEDTYTWQTNEPMIRMFNLYFQSPLGLGTTFGLFNNYLLCSSSKGLIELKINKELFVKLSKVLFQAFEHKI